MNKRVNENRGHILLLLLFLLMFFGCFALLIYASFENFVSQIAAPTITFMFMVTPLYLKYMAPRIPTKETIIAAVLFAVVEFLCHIMGEKFPPAFLIADVIAEIFIGFVFLVRWQKYL